MTTALPDLDLGAWLGQYLWPLARMGGFLMSMPVLGSRVVPIRVRMAFSIMLTVVAMPYVQDVPRCDPLGLLCWLVVVEQVLIGLAMGFCLQVLFQVFEISGQLVATQSGLGFSSMVDPSTGVSVASISQMYSMLVTLLFLALDGHLVLIEFAIRSFRVLPIQLGLNLPIRWHVLFQGGSWMFASALLVSLPALVALLVVNLALAVITRAAPQLNIFSIGFPITLLVGLLIIWLSLDQVPDQWHDLSIQAYDRLQQVLGVP